MYCVTGVGLSVTKYYANDHKKARWNRDVWDKVGLAKTNITKQNSEANLSTAKYVWSCPITIEYQVGETLSGANCECAVMERDFRITGSMRGQSTNVEAPTGFEVSNPWKVRELFLQGTNWKLITCNSSRRDNTSRDEVFFILFPVSIYDSNYLSTVALRVPFVQLTSTCATGCISVFF